MSIVLCRTDAGRCAAEGRIVEAASVKGASSNILLLTSRVEEGLLHRRPPPRLFLQAVDIFPRRGRP